ncbi:uncharacterized protein LOC17888798 [Capsella rubella]|nr:uncharacterized protein LOC17888798 [Capsella rubella]
MRGNFDSVSGAENSHSSLSPHLTQVPFNQTITNRYTTIIPTNTQFQYDTECVKRSMDSKINRNYVSHPPNFLDSQREVLSPTPLSVVYPHQDFDDLRHSDMVSMPSKGNHIPQDSRFMKKILKPKITYYVDSDEDEKSDDDQYDGRTHSISSKKYGPYTCPKCNNVFDTSQKFAAHMLSHYKSENIEEKARRLRARNKNRYCKLTTSLKRSK